MPGTRQRDPQNGLFMPINPTCDLYIITGERSGEAYAAAALTHLKTLLPELRCQAMGSDLLAAAGAEITYDSSGFDVMGYWPILKELPKFLKRRKDLVQSIRGCRPRVVLTVDYPGMNMGVLKRLGKIDGVTRIHVVAPQVWAWRPWRAKPYAQSCERLACFFPFEPAFFTPHGCDAQFIGHPMVDMIAAEDLDSEIPGFDDIDSSKPILLLAPGSRPKEVGGLLPIFDAAARRLQTMLQARGQEITVVIGRSVSVDESVYRNISAFPLISGHYRQLCKRAHVAMIASGTATLEAALIGLPHAACYKSDPATATLARKLINTRHIALPNIIHDQRVIPELLQNELNPERLSLHILGLWEGERRQACLKTLLQTADTLGGAGAMNKLANLIRESL